MIRELVEFLCSDLQFVRGVGPVIAARMNDVIGGRRIIDFLRHRPAYVRMRDVIDNVTDAIPGGAITIVLNVKSHKRGGVFRRGRRVPTQVQCVDKMGNNVVIIIE